MNQVATHIPAPAPTFNPAVKSLQFRAWAYCQMHGTNMTVEALAAAMDEPVRRLRRVLRDEKWARCLRVLAMDLSVHPYSSTSHSVEASEIARRMGFVGLGQND